MKTCPKCGTEHNKSGTFCSRSCANSRDRPQELRDRLSLLNKGKPGHNKLKGREFVSRYEKTCLECDCSFRTTNKEQKYCSSVCANLNAGGYREGSGRAKTGYYKGIYCGSTYELVWVIYQIDHNIPFERFDGCLEFEGKKYFPDFLQNGKIVEIKGYENQDSVDLKSEVARQNGFEVIVLRKEDLQEEFEWVSSNYTTNFKTLYDDYKPSYVYKCCNCSSEIIRDKKAKTEKVFCSRECSLLGNRVVSGHNQYTHREAAGVATSPSNWREGIVTPTVYQ